MSAMMVPEDWEEVVLSKRINILSGFAFSAEYFNDEMNGVPLIRIRDLERGFSETYYSGKYNEEYIVVRDDILIGMDGDFYVVQWGGIPSLLNQRVCKIKRNSSMNYQLLFYVLQEPIQFIQNITPSTTVKHLSTKDIYSIQVALPKCIIEQQKIATILSTLDHTIEATQKLIDKEKMVKKGLMADLLTHGIDEQGGIRSPHTHMYVDSPLGMIPEGWEVKALAQCAEIMNSNIDKKSHAEERAIRLCNYMDVYSNEEITNAIDFMQATATDNEIKKFLLKKNDVIITKDSESPDDIGIAAYVTQNFDDVLCGYHLTLLRPKKNCVGKYLSKALQSDHCVKYFGKVASGSTRYALSIGTIGNTKIIFPPMKEQERIATILSAQDRKIETEETNLAKLQNLKKGLMGDLLSGDVRVKV